MRTGIVFPGAEGRQRHVGQIHTTIQLANRDDIGRSRYGDIRPDQVRSLSVSDVLVDTGATLLALPGAMIAQLGLYHIRDVDIETATGFTTARIFGDVELTVEGRSAPFECLEMPGGESVLLGVLPLEALGLELDLQNQRLIVLPDRGPDTYVMAL
ncbi:MAG: aspartyl protease [Dehalococcoidia bacterium]